MPIAKSRIDKIVASASEYVDLRSMEFGEELNDENVEDLVECLLKSTKIKVTKVNLSCNNIGDRSIIALQKFKTLEELDISNGLEGYQDFSNHITEKGAAILAESSIKKLNIGGNSIGDAGIISLASSKTITTLNAEDCSISANGASELFRINTTLKSLDLRANNITDKGVETLSGNHSLLSLNLSACGITNAGAIFLCKNFFKKP